MTPINDIDKKMLKSTISDCETYEQLLDLLKKYVVITENLIRGNKHE